MHPSKRNQGEQLTKFNPELADKRNAQADAVIKYAKQINDWPMLEKAIEQKLEDQTAFIAWWDETVRDACRPNKTVSEQKQLSASEAENLTGITKLQVSKWRRRLEDRDKYKAMLYGAAYQRAMAAEAADTTALKWTGDPESYTPSIYIEAARSVMGSIDLDPASNELAQQTVKAEIWYGIDSDGLKQPWIGNVFLNPPYSYPTVAEFIDKLCEEFTSQNVKQAILLTNNNTDTKWWHKAAGISSGVCFTAGRINFYKSDGTLTQPTNGQNFFYFGQELEKFKEYFGTHGLILVMSDHRND